ncbi:MAG: hypothetical protein GYB65_10980 [Chloroflexi bacterium]|nr:hypothetical protein [Chloroflexota bacterium]
MGKAELDALARLLKDPDPNARLKACRLMADARDPQMLPLLREAYQDKDERVRKTAQRALAEFKAQHTGRRGGGFPISNRVLNVLLIVLTVVLVGSLAANGAVMFLLDDDDSEASDEEEITPRGEFIALLEERLGQVQTDAVNLRQELAHYEETGDVVCEASYNQLSSMGEMTAEQQQYADLAAEFNHMDAIVGVLWSHIFNWREICADNEAAVPSLAELDSLIGELGEIEAALETYKTLPDDPPGETPSPDGPQSDAESGNETGDETGSETGDGQEPPAEPDEVNPPADTTPPDDAEVPGEENNAGNANDAVG